MGVDGADLLSGPGELTEVGSVFVETYMDLQKCEDVSSSSVAFAVANAISDSAASEPSISGE